jgi:hypothetical protein
MRLDQVTKDQINVTHRDNGALPLTTMAAYTKKRMNDTHGALNLICLAQKLSFGSHSLS